MKHYLNSFKDKRILPTLTVDLIFVTIIYFLFTFFSGYLNKISLTLTAGQTIEQLQQLMLTAPQQAEQILSQYLHFAIIVIITFILLLIVTLLLCSLARAVIWNYLLKKKLTHKKYWKWVLLNVIIIVPFILYLIVAVIIKLLLNQLIFLIKNQALANFFNSIVLFIIILIFVIYLFLTYYSFTKNHQIWESLGSAFSLIKSNWNGLWKMTLWVILTAIVLGLILTFILNYLISNPALITIINLLFSLIYLAWVRIYLFRIIHHEH